ncbi:MAG: transketolase [Candidatus Babeliales bacterium]|nr:transketolase [Candidatus Babeliales bacterium]
MNKNIINLLEHKAYKLRYLSIISTTQAGSGHVTSCLSAADIVAALFFYAMSFDPQDSHNTNNDRFILSKGHAAPLLYAAWQQVGVLSQDDILTLRQFDSVLEGHPTPRFNKIEAATGSLGQGLSVGVGIAMSAKLDQHDFYTYVLIGDSESSEGQIWEAAQIASYYKLDNLVAILDVNRLGQTGETMQGWDVQNYQAKFKAFGWDTIIINGHDMCEIVNALDQVRKLSGKPIVIIAKTIKGYGVAMAENKNGFHGRAFTKEELPEVLQELHDKFSQAAEYKENEDLSPFDTILQKQNHSGRTERDKSVRVLRPAQDVRDFNNPNPNGFGENHKNKFTLPTPSYKQDEKIATRKVYGQALVELDDVCDNLLSLDAEVKNSTFAQILETKDAKKFIQCFIAEQNMISMAVGLTSRGKITFSSTFACFLSRAFDSLRMAAISRSPLRVCGSHAGVSIGQDGPSQMGLEDIAMFRVLPNSIILYPSDAVSTYKCVELMANYNDGISYLRTTRSDTPIIYKNSEDFKIGGCKVLYTNPQDKACIIAAGITLHEALKAYEELKKEGIKVAIIDLYCVKPIDVKTILETVGKYKKIITVEDHYLEGGLGQAVAFELRNANIQVECLAVTKLPRSGTMQELLAFEDIDARAIIRAVKKIIC